MRTIQNFNDKWAFTKDGRYVPTEILPEYYWVNLPHTWNNIDGQDGGNNYHRGTCYYVKKFEKTELPEQAQYYLEFRGANASATVILNGKKLAEHDGGYSTWRVNVTDALKDENLLVVGVSNDINDRVYPQQADFTFYGGLYRDVNLIAVGASHFRLDYYGSDSLKVTPLVNGTDGTVRVETWLDGSKAGQMVCFKIKEADGNVIMQKEYFISGKEDKAEVEFTIHNVHLWNAKKDPYLYTAEVCLIENDVEIDCVKKRFGVRNFAIDPERGFILNGIEYPLRGVSRHQDRWGIGNALLPAHHREDMDLICEMGANTIRLAHYQHDSYFYDLCDERGMIVWAEIPYISRHMPKGRENSILQMRELIVQNFHHPSIVVWGLSNEITMASESDEDLLSNHTKLNDIAHEMDPTRLTTIAVVTACDINDPYIKIPDVVAFNHYFGWYGGETSMNGPWFDHFHEKYPDIPVGVSEYGCEALNWHTSNPEQGDYTEEYQAYYHEELIKQLFTRKYLWATYVWNMFDFGADARCEGGEDGQNHKGLVTFDRSYKKDSFYAYKAWLSDEPFVHLCSKRYVDRVEPMTKVTVYSNQPEVELFVNGKSLGKQTSADHFFYFLVPNTGESQLLAVAGRCKDESKIRKTEVFNEKYRLKEKSVVLNWFDMKEIDGYFSLNDKICDIMETLPGKSVMIDFFSKTIPGQNTMLSADLDKMTQMFSNFTVMRLIKLLGAANISLTKEQLLNLNSELCKIKK